MNNKRRVEVSLPLAEISAQSAREKSIRHGHISSLHIWWARDFAPLDAYLERIRHVLRSPLC